MGRPHLPGIGPHPHDPDAFEVATVVASYIESARPGTDAKHVGSTSVAGLVGKGVVDLQITAEPRDVAQITDVLLSLGFSRQQGPAPWRKNGRCWWGQSVTMAKCSLCIVTSFRPMIRKCTR